MNGEKAQHPARRKPANRSNLTRAQRRRRRQRARRIKIAVTVIATVLIAGIILALLLRPSSDDNTGVAVPTAVPTAIPASEPTAQPENQPAAEANTEASADPTGEPTPEPTAEPTAEPVADVAVTDLSAIYDGGVRITGDTAGENMPYSIYVSKDTYTIAILGIDENGEYTRLLRTWRTAIGTGNKTRAGSYKIDKQYMWYDWSLGGYTPYTSRLDGAKIRLHAPLHNERGEWDSLWKEGYNQIGTQETQGCLRTTTEGAAWVYFNCKVGTEVYIANDSLYESAEPPALGDSECDPTRPVTIADLEVPVTFFTVDSDSIALTVGAAHQLTIGGILPDYEELTHAFTYVSGNEGVVSVDENGLITAVAPGSAQVLVMADDINMAYRLIEVTVN